MSKLQKKTNGVEVEEAPKEEPVATVSLLFFENRNAVEIKGFDKINPGKIRRAFGGVFLEYKRLLREARRGESNA